MILTLKSQLTQAIQLINNNYYHLSLEPLFLCLTLLFNHHKKEHDLLLNYTLKVWFNLGYEREGFLIFKKDFMNNNDMKLDCELDISDLSFLFDELDKVIDQTFLKSNGMKGKEMEKNSKQSIKLKPRLTLRHERDYLNFQLNESNFTTKSPNVQIIDGGPLKGNQVIAQRLVTSNEIVYQDKEPLVWCLNSHYKRNHCTFCLRKVGRIRFNCKSSCFGILYCSEVCRDKDWNRQHQILCNVTKLSKLGYDKLGFNENEELIIKLVAEAKCQLNSEEDILNYGGIPYLYCPCDDWNESKNFKLNEQTFLSSFHKFMNLKILLLPYKPFLSFSYDIYLKLEQILQCNIMNLNSDRIKELGSALYLFASMVNHSCASNCLFQIQDNKVATIKVRSDQSIQSGEEVTISYYPIAKLPLKLRREYFQNHYGFQCMCDKCLNDEKNESFDDMNVNDLNSELQERQSFEIPKFFDLSTLFDN